MKSRDDREEHSAFKEFVGESRNGENGLPK